MLWFVLLVSVWTSLAAAQPRPFCCVTPDVWWRVAGQTVQGVVATLIELTPVGDLPGSSLSSHVELDSITNESQVDEPVLRKPAGLWFSGQSWECHVCEEWNDLEKSIQVFYSLFCCSPVERFSLINHTIVSIIIMKYKEWRKAMAVACHTDFFLVLLTSNFVGLCIQMISYMHNILQFVEN